MILIGIAPPSECDEGIGPWDPCACRTGVIFGLATDLVPDTSPSAEFG